VAPAPLPVAEVTGDLAALGPIDLVVVDTAAERATYHQLLAQHPLGDQPLCGAQLRYLFHGPQGYLGAAACQSASFALKDRDQWLGWSEATRRGNLARVVANARFLILPGVRVPHLASHLLGQLARRLPTDWKARYGVRPLLLETFVHPDQAGTCYSHLIRYPDIFIAQHIGFLEDGRTKSRVLLDAEETSMPSEGDFSGRFCS
jgi:hypothetical protein